MNGLIYCVILISSRFTFTCVYLSCICILYTSYYLVCLAHFPFQILLLETSVSKLEFMKRVLVKCRLNLFRAYIHSATLILYYVYFTQKMISCLFHGPVCCGVNGRSALLHKSYKHTPGREAHSKCTEDIKKWKLSFIMMKVKIPILGLYVLFNRPVGVKRYSNFAPKSFEK